MGTWGTAIFSDDFALDIKSEFKDKIASDISPTDATNELIADYKDSLKDPEEASVFWLSLASAQWNIGRLQDNVKLKALEIIESGQDLERWKEDEKQLVQRKKVLEKLKLQLQSEQPVPKKIPKPYIRETKMEIGDLISYSHQTGKKAIFRVIDIHQDHCGDRYPQVEILNFFDNILPENKIIKNLKPIRIENNPNGNLFKASGTYYVAPFGKKDSEPWDKLKLIDKSTSVKKNNSGTVSIEWWKNFDEFLLRIFTEK